MCSTSFGVTAALNIAEQTAGVFSPYVVAAEPGPGPRDIAAASLDPGERRVKIPVGRPVGGDVRGDRSDGRECCVLILLGARFLHTEVLHQGERSAGNKHVSGQLPADLRVNPVKRGRGEHGPEPLAGKPRVLELSVHELHLSGAFQVLPGQRHEADARFQCRHPQSPAGQGTRELAASAPDLQHKITASDPRDPAGLIDELVRICRTVAVVLGRDLVEDHAVTTRGGFRQRCHSLASVHDRYRDRHVMGRWPSAAPPPRRYRRLQMLDLPRPSPGGTHDLTAFAPDDVLTSERTGTAAHTTPSAPG